ncbi:hypothetical protein [Hyella patelloides]|nr:hypothetical protein [Hyella patelloides]
MVDSLWDVLGCDSWCDGFSLFAPDLILVVKKEWNNNRGDSL